MVDIDLVNKVSDKLKKQKKTIATAESCTGGLLAHTFTNIPGSSDYFDRGVVTYSNKAKTELLGIPEVLLTKYGAVSNEVAAAMADAIRKNALVDYGLATTGIAGPTGGTKDKPVGLVYIALSMKNDRIVKRLLFTNDRLTNKDNTCNAALKLLLETLSKNKS